MKELKKYFEHYKFLYPNLSSFMWFVKAVKQTKPNERNIHDGFLELVNELDYSKSDAFLLLKWLRSMKSNNQSENMALNKRSITKKGGQNRSKQIS